VKEWDRRKDGAESWSCPAKGHWGRGVEIWNTTGYNEKMGGGVTGSRDKKGTCERVSPSEENRKLKKEEEIGRSSKKGFWIRMRNPKKIEKGSEKGNTGCDSGIRKEAVIRNGVMCWCQGEWVHGRGKKRANNKEH